MSLVVKWFPKTLQRDVLELNENSFAWLHSDCCLARWATWCYCLTGPGDGRRVSAVQNLKLKFNFSGSGSQTVENCLWRKTFYKFFARVESNADKRCPWRFVNKTKTVINPRDWFFSFWVSSLMAFHESAYRQFRRVYYSVVSLPVVLRTAQWMIPVRWMERQSGGMFLLNVDGWWGIWETLGVWLIHLIIQS